MKKAIPNLRAPKGFHFNVFRTRYDSIRVQLLRVSDGREIGSIDLEKVYPRYDNFRLETHSDLSSEFHNKGLGTLLYAKAIQWALKNGYKVMSSGTTSWMAKRVWEGKGIRKYYNIRRIKRWDEDDNARIIWHAHAKPVSTKRRGKKHGQKRPNIRSH